MSRIDQEKVTVTLDGKDLGTWDMFEGGAAKAESTKHRPGGMGPEESLGGPVAREDFTLQRLYKLERDHGEAKEIDSKVGRGKVVATRTFLDRDRAKVDPPIVFTGTLIGFTLPNHDSNSADRAMVQLEVSADEPLG